MILEITPKEESKRILIVDDEKDILETFMEMFQLKGFNCDGAENGQKALQLTKDNDYDIIVSDINMPVMNGTTFFTKFKEKNNRTPFIFITGYEITDEIDKVVKNATAVVGKPIDFQDFLKLIEKVHRSVDIVRESFPFN